MPNFMAIKNVRNINIARYIKDKWMAIIKNMVLKNCTMVLKRRMRQKKRPVTFEALL